MSEQLLEQAIEPQEAVVSGPSAAEQLREAREKLGLSREEVAAELRLHLKLITALEDNERSQLPPAAFIGGYLRAYAKLLGLPAEQLIAEYLNEGVAPAAYRPTDRSGAQVVSSQDPKYRMITFGVVGGLLLLFTLWWANDRYAFVTTAPSSAKMEEVAPPAAEEVALPALPPIELRDPPQEEAVTTVAPQVASSTPAKAAATTATVSAQTQPPASMAVAPVQTQTQPAPSKPTVAAAPSLSTATTVTEPLKVPPQTAVAISEPLPAATPQATLRLEYQAASWTQVEDAQGRTLVYDLIPPGRRLELRGVAPFKVFLGYAPGVLAYYNGSLYSHAAYQRGDLAKFNVGAAKDNKPLAR